MKLAGIDLAWRSDNNGSALAIAILDGNCLTMAGIHSAINQKEIKDVFSKEIDIHGVAIDAPLIIKNKTGQRICEQELGRAYGSRHASCHSSNLEHFPKSSAVELSDYLLHIGFQHLPEDISHKFQLECYPHPALIEIFGLKERLPYKKGNKTDMKEGQRHLARHIRSLATSRILKLPVNPILERYINEDNIESLPSRHALKENEDVLDSIICVYICALFAINMPYKPYGNINDGYIYVPTMKCIGN